MSADDKKFRRVVEEITRQRSKQKEFARTERARRRAAKMRKLLDRLPKPIKDMFDL